MKNKFLKFIGLIVLAFIPVVAFASKGFFSDVAPTHKNFVAITILRDEGVLNGFPDNTFKPDQKINRAETLKVLILGSSLTVDGVPSENPFPDVSRSEWFAPFVQKGKNLGIVKGTKEGVFQPERTVNRAEALKMLIHANGIELPEPKKSPYLDVPKDEWFTPYFAFAKDNGFFDDPEYAKPAQDFTRGELAEIFYRLEKWKKNHPPDIGRATYYADYFNGRKTANGEIFDSNEFTAAHQTFSFGTKVLVKNLANSKSVVVKINDRGPYAQGNIIDLTTTAFEKLAPLSQGVAMVQIMEMPAHTPLGDVTEDTCNFKASNNTLKADSFEGLKLTSEIPTIYRKNEVFEIEGTIDEGINTDVVTVFFEDKRFQGEVRGKKFSVQVTFDEVGNFNLGIIPKSSGTSAVYPFEVIRPICEPVYIAQSEYKPENLKIDIHESNAYFSWDDAGNNLFLVKFIQNDQQVNFYINGKKRFFPSPKYFANFKEGIVKIEIWGATKEGFSSLTQDKNFRKGLEKDIFVVKHHRYIVEDYASELNLPDEYIHQDTIEISGKSSKKLRKNATLILPSGEIIDVPLKLNNEFFSLTYKPLHVGTHIVEINSDEGFAIVNTPVIEKGFVPIIPDFWDLGAQESAKHIDLEKDKIEILKLVNEKRRESNLNAVLPDKYLDALAQFRAEDMRDRGYFGHIDPDGKDANDYRADHAVKTSVAENIALDANIRSAHEGLWRSAIHRRNILGKNHEKLGVGIAKKDSGEIIVVELFASSPLDINNIENARTKALETVNNLRKDLLMPNIVLDAVAQNWTEKMIKDNFFDFTDLSGTTMESVLRNAGVNKATSALIFQENSFADLLDKISTKDNSTINDSIFDSRWKNFGIGIYTDDIGTLKATIIVSE